MFILQAVYTRARVEPAVFFRRTLIVLLTSPTGAVGLAKWLCRISAVTRVDAFMALAVGAAMKSSLTSMFIAALQTLIGNGWLRVVLDSRQTDVAIRTTCMSGRITGLTHVFDALCVLAIRRVDALHAAVGGCAGVQVRRGLRAWLWAR